VPLLGEAVTLAGPIKGVTLDVATARGAVHGSGEVVFRRWSSTDLARGTGVPLFLDSDCRTGENRDVREAASV